MSRYDEVLYPGNAFSQAHPERLAAFAALMGLRPTPVESCRVLELGCGDGGHLIPIAAVLPGSRFIGIDLSQTAIDTANATVRELVYRFIKS